MSSYKILIIDIGLNIFPPGLMSFPEPQDVNLFGNSVMADVIC